MKKVILTMAMLLATGLSAIAETTNSDNFNMVKAYDINVNINSLARYLELSQDQVESVENVHKVFTESLRCAAVSDGEEARKNMVNNAINYDLKNMKYILTDEQYKKYVRVLNLTIINHKIEK